MGGWYGRLAKEWRAGGFSWRGPAPSDEQAPPPPSDGFTAEWPSDNYGIACRDDPDFIFRWIRMGREADSDKEAPRKMPLGMSGKVWRFTEKDQHLLAIAPPQSHAGKTSSVMIPVILGHPGPVVAATTKPDVLRATAQLRAQYGQLWVYSPDGAELGHLPPGVRELRWSPLVGAGDWDTAISTASAMTRAIDSSDVRGGSHWTERAGEMLAPFLHWAALTTRSMRDTHNAVYNATGIVRLVEQELEERGATRAANMLTSVLGGRHTDETTSIASTAARALRGYQKDAALRSTEDPNFNPIDFVNGGWSGVQSDTVYITGPSDDQKDVAPLVVGLLGQIQKVAYRRHRLAVQAELASPPIVFALDELYGLAPLPDLPHMLSEGGSQGVLIAAAVQDLTLIKSRWPKEAAAFLTLFGHVLVFPGVRDAATLKAVSDLLGKYDREMVSQQRKKVSWVTDEERLEHKNYRTERTAVLEEGQVYRGIDEDDPDALIHLRPGAWDVVVATPYWRSAPWPHLLTRYLERALEGRVPEWRYWESRYLAPEDQPDENTEPLAEDPLPDLPVPRLHDWAKAIQDNRSTAHPCDVKWAVRFDGAIYSRDGMLRGSVATDRTAKWELPSNAIAQHGIWITTHRNARVPGGAVAPQSPNAPPSIHIEPGSESAAMTEGMTRLLADIEAEKERRRARGDHESVDRFEAAMVKAHEDSRVERTGEEFRTWLDESALRREEARKAGATWWDLFAVPEMKRVMEEFLGGSWAGAPAWTPPPPPPPSEAAPPPAATQDAAPTAPNPAPSAPPTPEPPVPPVPAVPVVAPTPPGITEERWREIQDETNRSREGRVSVWGPDKIDR